MTTDFRFQMAYPPAVDDNGLMSAP